MRLLFIECVTLALFALSRAGSVCYFPDGVTTTPQHVPCNTTISDSSCCDPLDACTQSGLCLGRTGFPYRGTCTDSTWDSPNCSPRCHSDPISEVAYSSFTALWPCDHLGSQAYTYCCDSSHGNCCNASTFQYGTTGFAFKPGDDAVQAELANVSAASSGALVVTATMTKPTGQQATGQVGLPAQSSGAAVTSSSSTNLGLIIGAAVGVPLGILALGLLGFIFWKEKKKRRTEASQAVMTEQSPEWQTSLPPPPTKPVELSPGKPLYSQTTTLSDRDSYGNASYGTPLRRAGQNSMIHELNS